MKAQEAHDHLMSSLTDLVTSLMVIFILLLLVVLNNKGSLQAQIVRDLMKDLKVEFREGGFRDENIQRDQKDPGLLLFIVPERVMNFASNESKLKPEGELFIREKIPLLASHLTKPKFRPHVEAIIVEGHTDKTRPRGKSESDGEQWNLRLSQDRSMEVVKQSLIALEGTPMLRTFFLEKLSASGRGESEPASSVPDGEENRRVVFKIRIKPDAARQFQRSIRSADLARSTSP